MAVSHSKDPVTPEPVQSSFAQVLHANGPDTAHATKLALYSWIVGRWDMDVTTILEDGTTHRGAGEIHAGWVLQGRAIQDVWMIPRLRDRQAGIEPLPGAGNWYGTTLRIYDPELDAWRILWAPYTLHDFRISDPQVRLLGDEVAVLVYNVHEKLTVDGKPVTIDAADASAWVRRNGRWVCALHTESLKGDPFGRDRAPAASS